MLVADAARTVWRGGELFDAIVTDREREGEEGRGQMGWEGMGGALNEIALTWWVTQSVASISLAFIVCAGAVTACPSVPCPQHHME